MIKHVIVHGSEAIATKISTLLNYIKLLCFPHPLAADYSYNQIPYKQLTHWSVWVSLLVHGSMVYLAWKWMQERHPLAFAMAFYLLPLSLVSNLFFEIGATMGERLIYHSSLGFCVIVAFYAWTALATVKWPEQTKKETVLVAAVALVALGGYPVIQRNADWESDLTLFTKDVQTVPESALVNSHAGGRWVDLSDLPENRARRAEYLDKAIGYLNKSLILHPKCVSSYLNLGVAYYKLNDLEKARQNWDLARHYSPGHPDLKRFYPLIIAGYANQGLTLDAENAPPEATLESKAATERDPKMANAWYSLGGAYFAMEDMAHAKAAWEKALRSNPDHARARQGLDLFEAKSK